MARLYSYQKSHVQRDIRGATSFEPALIRFLDLELKFGFTEIATVSF